jgi:hypothetical protein
LIVELLELFDMGQGSGFVHRYPNLS